MPEIVALNVSTLHHIGLGEIRKRWGVLLAVGILLAILGSVAVIYSFAATLISMAFIGGLMIGAGVLQTAHGLLVKRWGGFFLELFAGILYTVVGFLIIVQPVAAALQLTLLIAMFLFVSGLFRIFMSISVRFHNWGWMLLNGIVNVLLGIAIWQKWPYDGLIVIGLFVGIDMIFNGWALIMLGLSVKNLPAEPAV